MSTIPELGLLNLHDESDSDSDSESNVEPLCLPTIAEEGKQVDTTEDIIGDDIICPDARCKDEFCLAKHLTPQERVRLPPYMVPCKKGKACKVPRCIYNHPNRIRNT